ncbi:MAG: carboxylating nicotinate-nucleotide diphosphorylase [Acidimicrobiia bacterium]|nr:carboxylating nicotinate-nucleotide diphosphorylase [Acidimicrobiia bacterium]
MTAPFDPPAAALRSIVATAIAEDLGVLGDITSIACVGDDETAVARLVSRAEGVIAGCAAVTEVYRQIGPEVAVTWQRTDGDQVEPGDSIGQIAGGLRSILAGERVALNLLSHCSGVASLTRRYVRAAHGAARIRDTRKTLPGLRSLEKAAVRAGGGFNHRDSLSDAVLIKDNHLGGHDVRSAIERARARWPGRIVEVECDDAAQVEHAADARPDLILLDNMSPEEVQAAVAVVGGRVPLEVSGGVDLRSVAAYADAGADYIAVGALTHSAPALDIGLDIDTGR